MMLQEIKAAFADVTGKTPKAWAMPAYPGTRLAKASEMEEEVKSTEFQSR